MGKVAIYMRVSTHRQLDKENEKNGGSLTTQWEYCVNYMKRFGYEEKDLIKFYDEGISGKTVAKRNGIKSLLNIIKKQNQNDEDYIEGICSYNLSRVSRSIKDSAEIYQLLKNNKIKLFLSDGSCNGDVNSPFTKMILTVLSLMNEIYLDNLRESVIPGMLQSSKEGNKQGGPPPYGYEYDLVYNNGSDGYTRLLVINEDEAEVVKRIFDMFINGESLYGICKTLNRLGEITKEGNQFKTNNIQYIIKNPVYIGKVVWGKQRTIDINESGLKEIAKEDVYDLDIEGAKGKHDAIINEEIYFNAMKRMKEISRPKKNMPTADMRKNKKLEEFYSSNRRIFSNVLCCPYCGSRMTTSPSYYSRKDGTNVEKYYYKCNAYNSGQNKCDGYYSVSEDIVYRLINEEFFRRLECIYGVIKHYKSLRKNGAIGLEMSVNSQKNDDLQRLTKRKKECEKQFKKVREQVIRYEGKNSLIREGFEEDLEKISNEIKDIDSQIEVINTEIEKENNQRLLLMKELSEQEKYSDIEQYFLNLPQINQRKLIEQVFDKIVVRTEGRKRTHKTFEVKEMKYNPDFSIGKIVGILGLDFNDFCSTLEKDDFEFNPIIKHFQDAKEFETLLDEQDQFNRAAVKINNFIDDMVREYERRKSEEIEIEEYKSILLDERQKAELKCLSETIDKALFSLNGRL